ncbi:MAG: isoprenoid biosynthesis glyoxalase ElbB [Planctomycetota bacterium]
MPKVGVILSGCGVYDGAEIHESVAVLHALEKRGAEVACLAPDIELDEIDHLTGEETGQTRRVLREAARIARGRITPLNEVKGGDFDAIVLPGGFGAAKNLCDFAVNGATCQADPETARVLTEAQDAGRPLGFACISPALAARVFGQSLHPTLTIGDDAGTAKGLEGMGATHRDCDVRDIVVDEANSIVSTPAYMYDASVPDVFEGIDRMVDRVLAMVREPARSSGG